MNDLKTRLMSGAGGPPIDAMAVADVKVPRAPPGQRAAYVMICVPSGRTWEARTSQCVAALMTYASMAGVQVGLCGLEGSMITKSRNDLVNIALKQNVDYIFWLDSDMVVPPETIVRFLGHKKDIVGATYNKRVAPYETLGKLKSQAGFNVAELTSNEALQEADELPGGCLLVRADIYRRLRWPYYWETYEWEGESGTDKLKNFLRDNYATEPPSAALDSLDGTPLAKWLDDYEAAITRKPWYYRSEDVGFCRKASKAGFRIWCDLHTTFNSTHLGILSVTCLPPSAPEADPITAAVM